MLRAETSHPVFCGSSSKYRNVENAEFAALFSCFLAEVHPEEAASRREK